MSMLVGLCGFKGSGKDCVAQMLVEKHGFTHLSFAAILKDIVATMFDWPRNKLDGLTDADRVWRETVDEWWATQLNIPNFTPRYVLQYFGTEVFRNHFHPDIWIKLVEKQIFELDAKSYPCKIVVSDCRFANEIKMLKQYGGTIIQIQRELPSWFYKYLNQDELPEEAKDVHISEIEWIKCPCDFYISNDETIDDLYEQINNCLF